MANHSSNLLWESLLRSFGYTGRLGCAPFSVLWDLNSRRAQLVKMITELVVSGLSQIILTGMNLSLSSGEIGLIFLVRGV